MSHQRFVNQWSSAVSNPIIMFPAALRQGCPAGGPWVAYSLQGVNFQPQDSCSCCSLRLLWLQQQLDLWAPSPSLAYASCPCLCPCSYSCPMEQGGKGHAAHRAKGTCGVGHLLVAGKLRVGAYTDPALKCNVSAICLLVDLMSFITILWILQSGKVDAATCTY